MEKLIGKAAVILAVVVFFVMASVGLCCGLSPGVCGQRGIAGAVIMYIAVRISGRFLVWAIVGAMAQSRLRQDSRKANQ